MDFQRTKEGILVMTTGFLSGRFFCQTFLLAEQPNGYYVQNDMLRFIGIGMGHGTYQTAWPSMRIVLCVLCIRCKEAERKHRQTGADQGSPQTR